MSNQTIRNDSVIRVPVWVQWIAFGSVLVLACGAEMARWLDRETREQSLGGWMAGSAANWLPYLPLLLTLPLWLRFHVRGASPPANASWHLWLGKSASSEQNRRGSFLAAFFLFLLAFSFSRMAGSNYEGYPPAYHDEYSYLFQAATYLTGHWAVPSHPTHPEWFDQMHVLNEGNFASRYFPGTGIWLAPFVAVGNPWLGHEIAQAICAMMLFWIGREISTNGMGLLAGIIFATSPGMTLFSTILVAHHPTLVGLLLFVWAFLRWQRKGENWTLLIAGAGLAYAMLCRPLTAAGFAFPFGVFFAIWWFSGWGRTPNADEAPSKHSFWERTLAALCLGGPLLIGFAILGVSNKAITGEAFTSPYQLYNEIYTPSHIYGFDNVVRGKQLPGTKVLTNYDSWAENLTLSLAVRNEWTRIEASLRWTLGIVPLLLAGIVCLLTPRLGDSRWSLLWYSILCLHVIYIPYWFSGIMGWHYVLETAPLWILIFAEGSVRLWRTWRAGGEVGMRCWWAALLLVTLLVNFVTVPPLWPAKLEQGMDELRFARGRYRQFRLQVDQLRGGKDALVLVVPDDSDRHMDYVTNSPTMTGPVVIARIRDPEQFREAAAAFPDRLPIVFNAAKREFLFLR
ncbi:ArnT family glycosyltransferase [Planctomicrobium sp. SH668]|uniref:ArnT family glycosyltransferase n=1 Tax=Planctomicrobium sp. SH668 TaxID=3448126 RepID=UPI003F5BA9AA